MRGLQRFHVKRSARRELQVAFGIWEYAMPMLMWFPAIVMAGLYQAMSDDFIQWQRACTRIIDRNGA